MPIEKPKGGEKEIPVRCNILYLDAFGETNAAFIVVVKKTARYSNVFFYNRTSVYTAIPQFGTLL
jgi:hypothetical protein